MYGSQLSHRKSDLLAWKISCCRFCNEDYVSFKKFTPRCRYWRRKKEKIITAAYVNADSLFQLATLTNYEYVQNTQNNIFVTKDHRQKRANKN